jgi:hypothetical protein
MASQFNTVGRHQALLAFTLRAGLKAFAMQLGAAIAVVFEQRDGVVDLFLYGERAFAHPAVADGKARLLEEILFLPHRQLVLLRQLDGRRRAHLFAASAEDAAPEVELPRQLAVTRSVSTVRAFDGQALTQAAQPIHCCGVCSGLPRKFLSTGIGSSGYACVAVPVLITFLIKVNMAIPYFSGEFLRSML